MRASARIALRSLHRLARLAAAIAMASPAAAYPVALSGSTAPAKPEGAAWFGLRLPGPESDPVAGIFGADDKPLPARPVPARASPADPALRGAALMADLRAIVGFSHASRAAGDYLWGRVTGLTAYDRTVDWVASRLRDAGLRDAHPEAFRATLSLPLAGRVRLLADERSGSDGRDIDLGSAMVQGSGPVNGMVTAPLVYADQGLEADLAGRDLKGRIAVIVSTPSPSLYAPVPAPRAAAVRAAGAAGVIEIQAQPGNFKTFDRDRHGCGTGLCFTLGGEDGFFLQTLLGRAAAAGRTITASLSARSTTIDRAVANVVATVPGRTRRTVIIAAHADGWFGGADDNGSGLAVFLALARHFAAGPRPLRTLVFVASAGHHSLGANGLTAFRAAHDSDYVAHADLILNIEHVASSATMSSYVPDRSDAFGMRTLPASGDLPKQVAVNNRAPYLIDLWRQGVRCFGLDTQRAVDTRLPGDLKAFADRPDIAQTQMIASGLFYHSSGDDLYTIPEESLERAATFYAYLIAGVANAPARALHGAPWRPATSCPAQGATHG